MPVAPLGPFTGAILLGVVQGLTEFLPVSSSGHLVLFQQFIDVGNDQILFDLVLHVGTLIPVLWYFRDQVRQVLTDPFTGSGPMLQREGVRLAALVVLASVPTAVIGLGFEDLFEQLFSAPAALAVTFAITGTLLLFTKRFDDGSLTVHNTPWSYAIALGVAQGLAITPGISRSGTTLAVALFLGLNREFAARMSFLMSVPAIAGAVLLKGLKADWTQVDAGPMVLGGVSSMVVGYLALTFLVMIIRNGRLSLFGYYCYGAAVVAAALAFLR